MRHAVRPAELLEAIQQGQAERAREMMAAFAPVQAGAAERPARRRGRVWLDAEGTYALSADWREREAGGIYGKSMLPGEAFVH
jgi:hypothetical protein